MIVLAMAGDWCGLSVRCIFLIRHDGDGSLRARLSGGALVCVHRPTVRAEVATDNGT